MLAGRRTHAGPAQRTRGTPSRTPNATRACKHGILQWHLPGLVRKKARESGPRQMESGKETEREKGRGEGKGRGKKERERRGTECQEATEARRE